MFQFKTILVGPEALQIDFVDLKTNELSEAVYTSLRTINIVPESNHHNTYANEYFTWYNSDFGKFTITHGYGDQLSIYAQGDNVLIGIIEKELLKSGFFEKIE